MLISSVLSNWAVAIGRPLDPITCLRPNDEGIPSGTISKTQQANLAFFSILFFRAVHAENLCTLYLNSFWYN